jgi:hypothetical protein
VVTLLLMTLVVVIVLCGGVIIARRRGHRLPWPLMQRRHGEGGAHRPSHASFLHPQHPASPGIVAQSTHQRLCSHSGQLPSPPPYSPSDGRRGLLHILGLEVTTTPKPPDYDRCISDDSAASQTAPPPPYYNYSERSPMTSCGDDVTNDSARAAEDPPPAYEQVFVVPAPACPARFNRCPSSESTSSSSSSSLESLLLSSSESHHAQPRDHNHNHCRTEL